MLSSIARVLTDSIDEITRRWVDDLRLSERTEVHKQLLSSEIVDGIKGMLANLAQTIEAREAPEGEVLALPPPEPRTDGDGQEGLGASGQLARPRTTKPLAGPMVQAQYAAATLGKLRHKQHYDIAEVVYEYVKLRQEIWATLRASEAAEEQFRSPVVLSYIDRLIDELMLVTIDNFYDTSVRSLEKRAIGDDTTKLYNKDYFRQRLNEELRRAVRYGQPISVVMVDVDNLKKINDTYGHPVGDEALRAVASAVRHTCRQTDVPCRYGGDEFVVILPETNRAQAIAFADRVMAAVRSLAVLVVPAEGQREHAEHPASPLTSPALPESELIGKSPLFAPSPTVSIGVASFPEDARNPETLLTKADDALYRAKKGGRNRVAE
jgi:diguanylate cyclase (GGDEF)-like protein